MTRPLGERLDFKGLHILCSTLDHNYSTKCYRLVLHFELWCVNFDFIEAQRLWSDQNLLEILAMTEDEPRFIVIGQIDARHWSAVVTYRGDDIRIISVRRSRDEKVVLYES